MALWRRWGRAKPSHLGTTLVPHELRYPILGTLFCTMKVKGLGQRAHNKSADSLVALVCEGRTQKFPPTVPDGGTRMPPDDDSDPHPDLRKDRHPKSQRRFLPSFRIVYENYNCYFGSRPTFGYLSLFSWPGADLQRPQIIEIKNVLLSS